jgi:hypothetical protein
VQKLHEKAVSYPKIELSEPEDYVYAGDDYL